MVIIIVELNWIGKITLYNSSSSVFKLMNLITHTLAKPVIIQFEWLLFVQLECFGFKNATYFFKLYLSLILFYL